MSCGQLWSDFCSPGDWCVLVLVWRGETGNALGIGVSERAYQTRREGEVGDGPLRKNREALDRNFPATGEATKIIIIIIIGKNEVQKEVSVSYMAAPKCPVQKAATFLGTPEYLLAWKFVWRPNIQILLRLCIYLERLILD